MERGLLLDVVVREGPPVLKLLACEDQPLLIRRDALLVLDLGLDILDGVGGLDLEGDGLAREGLDENLHLDSDENTSALSETRNQKEEMERVDCFCFVGFKPESIII